MLSFGASGSGKLDYPGGCIFYENTFIVSDTAKTHRLKTFDNSGKFLRKRRTRQREQGKGDGQLDCPNGLCVERSGNHLNILVCDREKQRIVQFTMEGSFTKKKLEKLLLNFNNLFE